MSKKIEVTFSLCKLVLESCAYRRACYSEDDCLNFCDNSHFINFTATSLLSVAILKWCELFGSHTNEFHWKKSVVDVDGFKQKLFDSVGGEEKWIFVRNTFKVARDQAIAHVEDGRSRSIIHQRHLVNTVSLLIEELKQMTTDASFADFSVSNYMTEKERDARRIMGNTL
jgi:hypothetical protein